MHACNKRCPHEGYPLAEGSIDGDAVLTCHWHNWKFDLATGANPYGGGALRIYPVKGEAGAVRVDARDPPAELRIARALQQLDDAMTDHDAARIARELARLGKAALQRWAVPDAATFAAQCIAQVLDHGLAEHLYPAHLLKTWTAVRDEIGLGVPDATALALRAAVNRRFGARFKQCHAMRTARQALGFVGKGD